MTIAAHHTYQRVSGATRTQFMIRESPPPFVNLFDELNPHLRNAQAKALGIKERIVEYLSRRPGRTPVQIAQAIGIEDSATVLALLRKTDLFRQNGRLWYVEIEQPETITATIEPTPPPKRTMTIAQYLAEHGPATAHVITDATGLSYRTVTSALSRGIKGIGRVGEEGEGRERSIVWGVTDALHS